MQDQNKALKGEGGNAAAGHFPELTEPHLVLASAAGMAATTSGSLHLQAGEHIALTSAGHTSLSVGQRLLVSAKQGLRLFALKDGMKFIAGKDKIQIEAHKDKVNLTAQQAVRITSTDTEIHFKAKKVVFNGGGSFTEWSGQGIVHGTQGRWVEHAAGHSKSGPMRLPIPVPKFEGCAPGHNQSAAGGAGVL